MPIYLYVKTHKVTGLKYLGQTTQDPYSYHGSGVYWKAHLAKHGYNYDTEILHECQDKNELIEKGLYYSKLWNVVESDEWANLKEEQGDGGRQSREVRQRISENMKGRTPWNKGKQMWNEEERKRISETNAFRGGIPDEVIAKRVASRAGYTHSKETRAKIGAKMKGRVFSEETRRKMSEAARNRNARKRSQEE